MVYLPKIVTYSANQLCFQTIEPSDYRLVIVLNTCWNNMTLRGPHTHCGPYKRFKSTILFLTLVALMWCRDLRGPHTRVWSSLVVKNQDSTDHSLLSLYALPLMSVLWFLDPAVFFISYPFSFLSFTVTSFIASVCEKSSVGYSWIGWLLQAAL